MSDINLTVQQVSRSAGANFTDNAVVATSANNYYFANDGNTRLVSTAAAGANITIETPNSVDGNAVADLVLVAGTGKTKVWGPWPTVIYGTNVKVTVSADTSIAAIRG
jgi:hypothetical protein